MIAHIRVYSWQQIARHFTCRVRSPPLDLDLLLEEFGDLREPLADRVPQGHVAELPVVVVLAVADLKPGKKKNIRFQVFYIMYILFLSCFT